LNDISEINHEPLIDSGQIRQFSSNNNDQSDEEPSSKRARISNTSRLLNVTFTVGPATSPSAQVDFTSQYRLILEEFINGTDQQFACPPTLTKEQREIVHQLADELNLKHESKGNWPRRRILFVYKTNPRGSQLVSNALQSRTLLPQLVNQNVMDVVNAPASSRTENIPAETQAVRRKRGRPPKNSTQNAASNGRVSQVATITQPIRTGLRSQTKK
jgi:hypothetical protein